MGHIRGKFREARLLYQGRVGRVVTMEEIAGAIGITRQALSEIERGNALPRYKALARFCKLYGMQPGELLVYVEEQLSLQPAPALQVQPTGG